MLCNFLGYFACRDIECSDSFLLNNWFRLLPVFFKHSFHLFYDGLIAEDDTNFAACFEFEFSQTLASDKRGVAVPKDRAEMQSRSELSNGHATVLCGSA